MPLLVASGCQYLEENQVLHNTQMGFRPQHSTESALLVVTEELKVVVDQGCTAAILLLDLSAAFDTVDHGTVIRRLKEAGITGTALKWLTSFLEDMSFQLLEGEHLSDTLQISCRVPQGSALSLTLFNLYMQPLAEIEQEFGLSIVSYSDDMQLVLSVTDGPHSVHNNLGPCLTRIADWMCKCYLKRNGDKPELMF